MKLYGSYIQRESATQAIIMTSKVDTIKGTGQIRGIESSPCLLIIMIMYYFQKQYQCGSEEEQQERTIALWFFHRQFVSCYGGEDAELNICFWFSILMVGLYSTITNV